MTRRLTIALLCLGTAAAVLFAAPVAAQQAAPLGEVDVVEVSGLIDPVLVDFISKAVTEAERHGAEALVIQLDSGGVVVGEDRIAELAGRLRASTVPVAVWIGPSGARARGGSEALVAAADLAGRAPGTSVRAPGPKLFQAPTLGDFIVELDGRSAKGATLETAKVVRGGDTPRREPTVTVRFGKLPGMARLLHTAASPSVAYLLLLVGMLLVVFELFTAGVGIAGVIGAVCVVLAGYGLEVLPTRGWALAALVVGVLGYTIDVQAGAPRTWSVIGAVLTAVGTARLYDGVSTSLVASAVGVGGVALAMVTGMPAMVRSRFSTPTIGRDSMIGEVGAAVSAVDPDGTVEVHGAPWRARTNRATPLAPGADIRVVGIDGLVLEVEPLEGAAKDYRRR